MSKERIRWIDTAKGIGIILVMLGHNYLDWKFVFWFYSFHMALFFFLSGYTFQKTENFKAFIRKKFKGLVVPYVFFALVISAYNWLSAVTHGNVYDLRETALSYLKQSRYTHLWFLPCLFIAELCMWVISKYVFARKGKKSVWLLIAAIQFALFFVYRHLLGKDLFWNADLAVLGTSFMSLGIWCRLNENEDIEKKLLKLPAVGLITSAHFVLSYISFVFTESIDWRSNKFGKPILFLICALLGIAATVLISKKLHLRALIYIGKNSIVWYGLHRVVIDATFILYNKLGITVVHGSALSLVLAIISVAIATLLLVPVNVILEKYLPFLIGKRRIKHD